MMLTVQRELSKRILDLNFFLRLPPQQAESAYSFGFFPFIIKKSRLGKGFSLLSQALFRPEVRRAISINVLGALELVDIDKIDGIIDISGFGYSDVWGAGFAGSSWAWVRYCHEVGIPYVYMPQAWGPFSNRKVAKFVIKMCKYSSLMYARDKESSSYLTELFEENKEKVRLAPDIAFKFTGARKEVGTSFLDNIGIETGNYPLVGMTPNLRVYERMEGKGISNAYVQLLIKIAQFCMREWNAAVVLIPHEIALSQSPQKDDRFLCGLVYAAIYSQGKVANMNGNFSADTIKSVISNLDLLIGSRFHSLVFALASKVPAIALGWTHKYSELMRFVGLGNSFLDLKKLDEETVLELLRKAWNSREKTKELLSECIPQIANETDALFDEVASILR